ncbi:MAG: peptidase M19 [Rhodospirillaceae bacterium]|nr:peptidase M19 [Rhodospirillaceae bacterium]|tara:strand:+ start:69 stop:1046 length:978 start_codon:yes stop_codon:yes gene_type:complete
MDKDLHKNSIVIDGLVVSNWSREVFADMRKGGLTAANCTCSVWEGIKGTLNNIAHWKYSFETNKDLILQVKTSNDIHAAKKSNRTGIILGWQNTSGIEDHIDYLGIFKDLGVGIMQLTYNTQNLVGSGCYESHDSGLSDFGRDVVDEMNRLGILIDLSHVGAKTSDDAIRYSKKPVAYSHCLPSGLKDHPRNKTNEQLKFIADSGGFIGVTMFPPFLKNGANSTIDDYVEAIDYVVNLVGEDCVGFGTDFTQDHDDSFFQWITHDKGSGRKLVEFGEISNPLGLQTLGEYPNLTEAMLRGGWSENKVRKIMGENWLRLLREVWGA